jgi:hypothetical protein
MHLLRAVTGTSEPNFLALDNVKRAEISSDLVHLSGTDKLRPKLQFKHASWHVGPTTPELYLRSGATSAASRATTTFL